jgi:hypothetical protein
MHIFSTFISLVDDGVTGANKGDIFAEAQNYLDDLVEDDLLSIPEEERVGHWFGGGSRGLQYAAKGDDAALLMDMIDGAIAKVIVKKRRESVDSWLDKLGDFDSQFLTDIGNGGKYYREPVFQYIDPDRFVEVLWKLPNLQKYLVGSTCQKRYELYSQDLLADLTFWQAVQITHNQKLDRHEGLVTPSIRNLKIVSDNVEKIVSFLKKVVPQ